MRSKTAVLIIMAAAVVAWLAVEGLPETASPVTAVVQSFPVASPTSPSWSATIEAYNVAAAAAKAQAEQAYLDAAATERQRELAAATGDAEMRTLQVTQDAELHLVALRAVSVTVQLAQTRAAAEVTAGVRATATAQTRTEIEQAHEDEMAAVKHAKDAQWAGRVADARGAAKASLWIAVAIVAIGGAAAVAVVLFRAATAHEVEHKLAVVAAVATGHAAEVLRDRKPAAGETVTPAIMRPAGDIERDDLLEFLEVAMRLGTLAQTQIVSSPDWQHGAGTWRRVMDKLVADDRVYLVRGAYVPKPRNGVEITIGDLYHHYANASPTPGGGVSPSSRD